MKLNTFFFVCLFDFFLALYLTVVYGLFFIVKRLRDTSVSYGTYITLATISL